MALSMSLKTMWHLAKRGKVAPKVHFDVMKFKCLLVPCPCEVKAWRTSMTRNANAHPITRQQQLHNPSAQPTVVSSAARAQNYDSSYDQLRGVGIKCFMTCTLMSSLNVSTPSAVLAPQEVFKLGPK